MYDAGLFVIGFSMAGLVIAFRRYHQAKEQFTQSGTQGKDPTLLFSTHLLIASIGLMFGAHLIESSIANQAVVTPKPIMLDRPTSRTDAGVTDRRDIQTTDRPTSRPERGSFGSAPR
jgi:hypothetical protein